MKKLTFDSLPAIDLQINDLWVKIYIDFSFIICNLHACSLVHNVSYTLSVLVKLIVDDYLFSYFKFKLKEYMKDSSPGSPFLIP